MRRYGAALTAKRSRDLVAQAKVGDRLSAAYPDASRCAAALHLEAAGQAERRDTGLRASLSRWCVANYGDATVANKPTTPKTMSTQMTTVATPKATHGAIGGRFVRSVQ